MKTFLTFNSISKRSSLIVALIGTAVFFNSCKNDINESTPAISALTVVNASPNDNTLDFYIGNSKVNNTGIAFGEKINYFQAFEGDRSVNVTVAGSLTNLKTKSISLKGGMYHSLFIIGKTAEDLDFLVLEDTPTPPKENYVNLRFINLSPDATSLSLELVGDTTKFEDKAFKGVTPFKPVPIAKSKFVLKDKADNSIKATLESVDLVKGKIYTIWAKGLANTTTEAHKLSIKVSEY